jgi:hypothetical protein
VSYDPTDLSELNLARALLGDTAAVELLTDDHIDAVLSLYEFNGGVAFLADELAIRYAQQPDRVTLPSGLSVAWSARVAAWRALAVQMRGAGVSGYTAFSVAPTRIDGYSVAATE